MDNLYSMPVPPCIPWKTAIPAGPGEGSAQKREDEETHRDGYSLPSPSLSMGREHSGNLEKQEVQLPVIKGRGRQRGLRQCKGE